MNCTLKEAEATILACLKAIMPETVKVKIVSPVSDVRNWTLSVWHTAYGRKMRFDVQDDAHKGVSELKARAMLYAVTNLPVNNIEIVERVRG